MNMIKLELPGASGDVYVAAEHVTGIRGVSHRNGGSIRATVFLVGGVSIDVGDEATTVASRVNKERSVQDG